MRIKAGLGLGLLLALAMTACGGDDGGPGVATAGGATPQPSSSTGSGGKYDKDDALAFARCMRDNGVPEFPDPEFAGNGGVSLALPKGVDPAKVKAAEEKCKQYSPHGGEPPKADPERLEQMRKYAQCMRENGIPNFPDPRDDGGIQLDMNKLGLNGPDDPKMKAAEEECRELGPQRPGGGTNQRKQG